MSTPNADARVASPGAGSARSGPPSRQKVQWVVLGGLSLLLVVVVVLQLGAEQTEYEVAALAADAVIPVEQPPEPTPAAIDETPHPAANAVLAAPPPEEELVRNPFAKFWSRDEAGGEDVERLPPPQVILNLTLPAEVRPLAVIDGAMRFVGEDIQGWRLAEVRARAIVLQSPSEERLVIDMPVHLPVIEVPGAEAPAELTGAEGPEELPSPF